MLETGFARRMEAAGRDPAGGCARVGCAAQRVAHAGAPTGEALYTTAGNRAQVVVIDMVID
ncbi:MAG: hypothetical protein MUE85_13845 [Microscillaceae bacterium]|nr:hypothetical protein [Microscillaceae bacterium]